MTGDVLCGSVFLSNVIELVMVFGIIYMVSYGSMLIVWCILRLYLLVMSNMITVLMGIVFYGGLMVVTILMVIPNGNAHYYYSRAVMLMAVQVVNRSVYLGVLVLAILMLVLLL